MTALQELTVGAFQDLMDLRARTTRTDLKTAWLNLSPQRRAALRWDDRMAAHATRVLRQDSTH